jgi:putative flippase GtrA
MAQTKALVPRDALSRFGKFLIVGGVNTAFGYGVFFAVFSLTNNMVIAPIVATLAGVFFNFLTTGKIVFNDVRAGRLGRFILVYACQVGANIALLHALSLWKIEPLIGQLMLLPFLAVASFWGLATFVFTSRNGGQP